ncbi:MAG TPA: hypothetical protein VFU05_01180 [Cyclobacteriaceae bacterium]|nr:hypothetical protein [Cyclobacteriaceae bacterium]
MLKILLTLLIFSYLISQGQNKINSTDAFTVSGKIKKEITVTLKDLQTIESKSIPDVVITNHLGEPKGASKNLKGILLKDALGKIEFDAESPKVLSEFYMVFTASDGYKVVFSWNEIFNTATGDNVYLITSKDGKELKDMDDRILVISTTDFKTGRRNVKGLAKIVVERAK